MRGVSEKSRILTSAAVIALLGAFFLQSVLSMRLFNASSDETIHLPAGYTYLKTGDYRLNPEHPPLMKQIAALPLLALEPALDLTVPTWTEDPPRQLPFGVRFLYTNDADRLLFWGRLPIVLLSLAIGVYVFLWSRGLFGPAAGWVGLVLFAFSPNLLAHSHWVTMDAGLALFTIATMYHAWRWAREGARRHLLLTGLALGAALGAKFSAGVLLPALALVFGLEILKPDSDGPLAGLSGGTRRQRLMRALPGGAIILAIAGFFVWALYLFPADPLFYWKGIRQVNLNHNPDYLFYMLGEFKQGGWWYYPLVAFALKTPLPTMILLVASIAVIRRHRASRFLDGLYLVVPALALTAATCALADNLGLRYLLPVYPLLFVFVSRVGLLARAKRWALGALAFMGLWYAGSTLAIYPDHLAFFNESVGGPSNGHRYLDDSNVEWGQDLKRLKTYMDDHGIEGVHLLYSWNALPHYYGIQWRPIGRDNWRIKPQPGYYAISTQWLIRGELVHRTDGDNTDWLSRYEPYGRVGYGFYVFHFE